MDMRENLQSYTVKNHAMRGVEIKSLDRAQILSSLPSYDQLYRAVQMLRQRPNMFSQGDMEEYRQSHVTYDNILSIFGGRGSGKTSVLRGLRKQLVEDRRKGRGQACGDIILPILSPEIISDNSTMLSWVLAMFLNEIESMDRMLKRNPQVYKQLENKYSSGICDMRARQSFLRREYDSLMRESGSDRIFREMHRYEYEDLLNLQALHAKEQYQLMNRLRNFWRMIVDVQQALHPEGNPLIFIMFDDIDLAPERSMELLMSAYKYFSSPHVVIVLTAARKTLHQVLTYRMYEKVVGSDFASLIQGNDIQGYRQEVRRNSYRMDRASESAIEYLNKVIPQSSRYELNRFDTYDKKLTFRFPLHDVQREDGCSSMPLGEFLVRCIEEYGIDTSESNFVKDTTKSDVESEHKEKKEMSREFYLLFGDKSRYITNACLGIMNTCEQLEMLKTRHKEGAIKKEEYRRTLFYALRHCLSVLINSHTRSMEECIAWLSQLFRYEYENQYLVIDYGFLLEKYRESIHEVLESVGRELASSRAGMSQDSYWTRYEDCMREKRTEIKQRISVLFVMLFFVENLVRCMISKDLISTDSKRMYARGLNSLLAFLNESASMDGSLTLFPDIDNMKLAMELYAELLEGVNFEYLSVTDGRQVDTYFSYLGRHSYFMKLLSTEGTDRNLYETCNSNPNWVRSVGTMLYLTQSGIQLLQESFFENLKLFVEDVSILPGLHKWGATFNSIVQEYISNWNLFDKSTQLLQRLEEKGGDVDMNIQCPEEEPVTWDSLINEFFKTGGRNGAQEGSVDAAQGENTEASKDSSNVGFAHLVCTKVEQLVRECYIDLNNLTLDLNLPVSRVEDMCMVIRSLCEAFPEAKPLGNAILQEIEREVEGIEEELEDETDDGKSIPLNYRNSLRFLLQCNTTCRVANRQKGHEIVGAYYRSLIQDFADQMELTISKTQMKGTCAFLSKLKTVEQMLQYYFSARFILANAARYDELHLGQEENKTRGRAVATTVYQNFLQAIKLQEYSVLRGFMLEIRAKYTAELRSSFEVTP